MRIGSYGLGYDVEVISGSLDFETRREVFQVVTSDCERQYNAAEAVSSRCLSP